MKPTIRPTGREVFFDAGDIIVSKTDLTGRITYANRTFLEIAGYREAEVIGQPHSIIRHPDMPRAVFRLLWEALGEKREIFAYVKNMTKTGDHYWVFAHVTPSIDGHHTVVGYHSNRRAPDPAVVARAIEPLYAALLKEEQAETNAKKGLLRSAAYLDRFIAEKGLAYDDLVFAL